MPLARTGALRCDLRHGPVWRFCRAAGAAAAARAVIHECTGRGRSDVGTASTALRYFAWRPPVPHLHLWDWAHPCHICTGTGRRRTASRAVPQNECREEAVPCAPSHRCRGCTELSELGACHTVFLHGVLRRACRCPSKWPRWAASVELNGSGMSCASSRTTRRAAPPQRQTACNVQRAALLTGATCNVHPQRAALPPRPVFSLRCPFRDRSVASYSGSATAVALSLRVDPMSIYFSSMRCVAAPVTWSTMQTDSGNWLFSKLLCCKSKRKAGPSTPSTPMLG